MIELVLIVFLISVALVATMAIKVGMKAVDFIEDTRGFYQKFSDQQERIIRLLETEDRSGDATPPEKKNE